MRYRQSYTLYERGGYYYYRVYDNNGRRIAKSTGQKTKAAARRYCDNLLASGKIRGTTTTVATYADFLFSENSEFSEKTANTKKTYCYAVKKFIIPQIGKFKMSDITHSMLKAWRYELAQTNSARTVNLVFSVLQQIFLAAVKDDVITRSPLEGLKRIATAQTVDAFTAGEVCDIIASLDGNEKKAVILLALCGLRIGELQALNPYSVHENNGNFFLVIDKQKTRGKITPPKNKKSRVVPLCPALAVMAKTLSAPSEKRIRDAVSQVASGRKDKRLVVHSLRHFFITAAKSFGVPFDKVEFVAGHSLKGIVQVYTNYKISDLQEICNFQADFLAMYVSKMPSDTRESP